MKIKNFTALQVHGYLNFNITFNDALTFLVGINGSGKTSVLKLIQGIIMPSYDILTSIQYEYVSLVCVDDNDEEIEVSLSKMPSSAGERLSVNILVKYGQLPPVINVFKLENVTQLLNERYILSKRHFEGLEAVIMIKRLNTPFFLGIDRNISLSKRTSLKEHVMSTNNDYRRARELSQRKIELNTPNTERGLLEVQDLIYNYYRYMSEEQLKISEDFKKKILTSIFKFYDDSNSPLFDFTKVAETLNRIDIYKASIIEAAQRIDVEGIEDHILAYFKQLDALSSVVRGHLLVTQKSTDVDKKSKAESEYYEALARFMVNSPQIRRMDDIIAFSETYQNEVKALQKPIRNMEDLVNDFYKEANKAVVAQGNGDIKIKLPNQKLADLSDLSSGEKQILIMIAHLIFYENEGKPGIFIIDEPEVSLHIAWQEIFVDSIMKASPKTQFILATHSPSIIGGPEREIFCEDLSK